MKKTVFPKHNETAPHKLDPLVRQQLEAKPSSGDFFAAYKPNIYDIDVITARNTATFGLDISEGIHVHSTSISGKGYELPARVYRSASPSGHIVLFLHGGAFMFGSVAHKDAQCRYLAQVSDATVISVEYRLAPENPYPAAVEDTIEAIRACCGYPQDRLIIGGDSAGACLAANAIMRSKAFIDYAFFIYGAFDLNTSEHMRDPWSYEFYEHDESERDLIYNRLNRFRKLAVDMNMLYVRDANPCSRRVSPAFAKSLSMFPSSLLVIAEFDYYRPCNEAFARRLDKSGVDTEVLFYEGVDHGFFDRLGTLPQAKECIEEIGIRIKNL